MTNYLPEILCALACVLLLLVIGAVVFMRRRSSHAAPPPAEPIAPLPASAQEAEARRLRLAQDLQQKLLRDYQRPGGLRSQCLTFLMQMDEADVYLTDLETIRVHLCNSCLYPLHIAVMHYADLFADLKEPQPPLLSDLVAVFNSDTLIRFITGHYADLEECIQLLHTLSAGIKNVTDLYASFRRGLKEEGE